MDAVPTTNTSGARSAMGRNILQQQETYELAYQHSKQCVSTEAKQTISASQSLFYRCTQQYQLACAAATQI